MKNLQLAVAHVFGCIDGPAHMYNYNHGVYVGPKIRLYSAHDAERLTFVRRETLQASAIPTGTLAPIVGMAGKPLPTATPREVSQEYYVVLGRPGNAPDWYSSCTKLIVGDMASLITNRIAEVERNMIRIFPAWAQFPAGPQIALVDMAFDIDNSMFAYYYPKVIEAAKRQDWYACATASYRKSVSERRNNAVRERFLPATPGGIPIFR